MKTMKSKESKTKTFYWEQFKNTQFGKKKSRKKQVYEENDFIRVRAETDYMFLPRSLSRFETGWCEVKSVGIGHYYHGSW